MENIELKETLTRLENKLDNIIGVILSTNEVKRAADENGFFSCQSTSIHEEGEDEPHGI